MICTTVLTSPDAAEAAAPDAAEAASSDAAEAASPGAAEAAWPHGFSMVLPVAFRRPPMKAYTLQRTDYSGNAARECDRESRRTRNDMLTVPLASCSSAAGKMLAML